MAAHLHRGRNLTIALALIGTYLFSAHIAHAAPPLSPYAPGDTIAPSCAPGSTNCTVQMMQMNATNTQVTFNDGGVLSGTSSLWFNKTSGVLAASGIVLTNATTTTLSLGSLNGFLKATAGLVGTSSISLGTDTIGTLGIARGGTGTTTLPSAGQLLIGNASGTYDLIATSSLGFVTTNVTEGTNKYYTSQRVEDDIAAMLQTGSGVNILHDTLGHTFTISASGGGGGGTDVNWSYINGLIHPATSTNIVVVGGTSASGTSKLQVTGGAQIDNATTSHLTVTNSAIIGSLSGLLFGTNGTVSAVATSALALNTDTLVEGSTNLFWTNNRFDTRLATATSSLGLLTTSVAEGTNLYYLDSRARSAFSETVTGLDYATSTGVLSLTAGYVIPLLASTTEWSTAYANQISSTSAGLSIANHVLSLSTSGDWGGTFDGQEGSYYLDRSNHTGTQSWSTVTSTPTTLSGYGITDATSTARAALSSLATGLSYATSTGIFSLTSGYTIPLTASTTEWANTFATTTLLSASSTLFSAFYTTPSTRITAGTNLAWIGNTLNVNGIIAVGNGGTGTSTAPSAGQILIGNGSGGYNLVATSSLAINTNNLVEGSNLFYTDQRVSNYISGSSTFPALANYWTKTGGNLSYTGNASINGTLSASSTSIGTLSGVLFGTSGTVGTIATSSLNIITAVPTGLTWATSTGVLSLTSGYTIPLTASTTAWNAFLNAPLASIAIATGTTGADFNVSTTSSSITLNIPTASASNRGVLSTTDWSTFNNKQNVLSLGNLTVGTGLSVSGGTGAVVGAGATVSAGAGYTIPLTASTTEWANTVATTTLLSASSTLFSAFYTTPSTRITAGTNLAWSGNTLNVNGVLGAGNGGTGTSTAPLAGQILIGNGSGGYTLAATATLGLLTTNVTEGTNLYWTDLRFDARLAATTSLPNLATLAGLTSASSLVTVGTLASGSIGSGFGNVNIGANVFTGVGSGITGLSASNVTAGTLSITRGGTGTTTAPSIGQILVGNGSGGYNITATSSLGFVTSNILEGTNLYWTNARFDARLSATTSLPNITTLSGLTSLPALTLSGDINGNNTALTNLAQLTVTGTAATSTFGTGGLTVGGSQLVVQASTGRVGIGLTSPAYPLHVKGDVGGAVAKFETSGGSLICSLSITTGLLSCSSDRNLKKEITPLASSTLEKVAALAPVSYLWKTDNVTATKKYGFIAQEVESIFPELVTNDPETGYKQLSVTGLIPFIVKAFQEESVRVAARIASLTATVQDLIAHPTFGTKEKPTGITIYDQETGEPYCIGMRAGQWVHDTGTCSDPVTPTTEYTESQTIPDTQSSSDNVISPEATSTTDAELEQTPQTSLREQPASDPAETDDSNTDESGAPEGTRE